MGDYEQEGKPEDEFSAMAWEIATRGKNRRDIAHLHESWAAPLLARGAFDIAQDHLDQALEAWTEYNEPALAARTWCLKASCSGEADDFATAAASFKRAQQYAEEAGDTSLALCAITNRAICEIRRGDPKAAATRSRRAFVKAEAEGDLEMILVARVVRAASYQMAGNFLAACNEHEEAAKIAACGAILPPEPTVSLAMDTNHGISILRSGKPERAAVTFERALQTVREQMGGQPSLTLARCLFHAGEARRQARDFTAAGALLEEAAVIVVKETTAAEASGAAKSELSKWSALAMEVANSRGLHALQEGAERFRDKAASGGDDSLLAIPAAVAQPEFGMESLPGQGAFVPDAKRRASNIAGESESEDTKEPTLRGITMAEKAAMLIADGSRAGAIGGHAMQKANNDILQGVAWSLVGVGTNSGVAALKRSDNALEKLFSRGRSSLSDSTHQAAQSSEAVGESVPAGNESEGQLCTLQLGVLCCEGAATRGGLGLGAACTSGNAARALPPGGAATAVDAAGALAAVAAARAATKAANSGWAMAGQLVKKHLAYASQMSTEPARQMAVAQAHAGAIDLMTGKPKEATKRFESQLEGARKAGDTMLEALAERNLADIREVHGDLPGALPHLRRCRSLAQRGSNAALEADSCRRLSSAYAEIAGASSDPTSIVRAGVVASVPIGTDVEFPAPENEGRREGEVEDKYQNALQEPEVEEREDSDWEFLKATAGGRARLFAERYEAAVSGLRWPVGGGFGDRREGLANAEDGDDPTAA